MPFLLWIVYPYSICMGCCTLMLESLRPAPALQPVRKPSARNLID